MSGPTLLGTHVRRTHDDEWYARTPLGAVAIRYDATGGGWWRAWWWPKGSRGTQYGVVVTDGYRAATDAIAAAEKRFGEMRRAFAKAGEL